MVKIRIDIPNFHDNMFSMIKRPYYIKRLSASTKRSPVTALLGPRQCGKTTLAQSQLTGTYLDLERPSDFEALAADLELALGRLPGPLIVDEAQRLPQLFTILRSVIDQRRTSYGRFFLLG